MNNAKQLQNPLRAEDEATVDAPLGLESKYCSWGDTVHYSLRPNIFRLAAKLSQKNEMAFEEKGKVHFNVGGYYKNVFTIAPSFYITEKEIDLRVDLFEEAILKAVKKAA